MRLAAKLAAETVVVGLQLEDGSNSGEIQPSGEQLADAPQSVEVIRAVQTSTAASTSRFEESPTLVQAQALRVKADKASGDRDAVHPAAGVILGQGHWESSLSTTTCIGLPPMI